MQYVCGTADSRTFAWQGHTGRIALILLHENVTNGAFLS